MYYYPNTQQNYGYNMQAYNNTGQMQPVGYGGYNNPYNNAGQILPVGYGGYNQYNNQYNNPYNNMNYIGSNSQYNPYYNNGGYYSGYYNNFNPYELQKQRQMQIDEYNRQQQYQVDMLKTLYKSSCSYTGTEVTDEALHFYDRYSPNYKNNGPDISDLTYEQRIEYNTRRNNDLSIEKSQQECYRMNNILMNQQYNSLDLLKMSIIQYNAQVFQKERERVPADTDLVTYLNKYASKDYYDALQNINKKQQSTSQLYNSGDYNALLNKHKNTLFGNALNPNANLDDQEITLPTSISDEQRQERRRRFFESIMQNQSGGISNG